MASFFRKKYESIVLARTITINQQCPSSLFCLKHLLNHPKFQSFYYRWGRLYEYDVSVRHFSLNTVFTPKSTKKMASFIRRKESIVLARTITKNQQYQSSMFCVKRLLNHPKFQSFYSRWGLSGQLYEYDVSVRYFSTSSSKYPEYQMPTVTWGAVQGEKEKILSRVMICDYLKSIGIVPDELEELELPSNVEVMRERVEFLQKLGLEIDDINEYPLMLGCSVRKNMIPVLSFLEKIGVPRDRLGEFLKSHPQCLSASVVVELQPVIKFLRGIDVEKEDIGYVLMKYPEFLGFKIEGTMSTSVAYLVSIGVSPREIGPMVTEYPYFLGMRVGTMIKPLVDYLVSLGLPKMILARMLEKRVYILGYDLEETVKPNVDCLISFGIRKEAIPKVIAQYPQILSLPLKAKLSSQQYFFNLKLKIDPDGFARVVENMPQIISLNQSLIMKPVEFFLGRGFSSGDVAKMMVKCPQLVAVPVAHMKTSYYFFKSEIGKPLKDLVEFSEYFTYSLESRIKPRYQSLQVRGIQSSLAWFLNCSDKRFEERLYGHYMEMESFSPSFYMGGKLELRENDIASEEKEEEDENESDQEMLYRRTVSL